jgi:hypothetical protein
MTSIARRCKSSEYGPISRIGQANQWRQNRSQPSRISIRSGTDSGSAYDLIQIKTTSDASYYSNSVQYHSNQMGREGKMVNFIRASKIGVVVMAAALLLVSTPSRSTAEVGRIHAKILKAGFIVGLGGGSGTLTYHGRKYPLRLGGISAGMIGVAGMDLVGTASNFRTPADIAGAYTAVGAGVALVGGAKVARLQNANGVVIELHGVQVGLDVSLNLSGLTIEMGPPA